MTAIYNEIDPFAAAWLRQLVRDGHIANGVVNEKSVVGLDPVDVAGATQFHTFAGIGVWSYALRLAGWPDDRPVWTGSCPCQPFSAAGKRGGFEDERHLWPAWFRLIRECRPPVIFGEQVASKDGLAWLDAVYADLEGAGYAVGAVDLCAAGVGAPHIRQRLFFVAERLADPVRQRPEARLPAQARGHARHAEESGDGVGGRAGPGEGRPEAIGLGNASKHGARQHARELHGYEAEHAERAAYRDHASVDAGAAIGLADAEHHDWRADESWRGPQGRVADGRSGAAMRMEHGAGDGREPRGSGTDRRGPPSRCGAIGLADDDEAGRYRISAPRVHGRWERTRGSDTAEGGADGTCGYDADGRGAHDGPGPTNGHWRDPDWLYCRDGKWRPVEPGTFPLAHGAPARVGRLRGYGNAIVAQAAAEVIRAYMGDE